eukprot:366558-Chlamydomonas_euryale.AAC.14
MDTKAAVQVDGEVGRPFTVEGGCAARVISNAYTLQCFCRPYFCKRPSHCALTSNLAFKLPSRAGH